MLAEKCIIENIFQSLEGAANYGQIFQVLRGALVVKLWQVRQHVTLLGASYDVV